MRLWDWAVAAYAAPDVAEACLLLQDRHEQNVPLLLWSAWVAATGRRPDEETLEAACDTARAWDSLAVAPLRLLAEAGGVLDRLDAAGFEIIGPAWKAEP